MDTYTITLEGQTPLFMHADNIEWADTMEAWKNDPVNKKLSKPGDDRSPAFRWLGSCYHDDEHFVVPTQNLQKSLMEGGAQVYVPGGRSGKTFKAQTQSGCRFLELSWTLLIDGEPVPWAPFGALMTNLDFETHKSMALEHRFELHVGRAIVQGKRHIRVRPWFKVWSVSGQMRVSDEQITPEILSQIWNAAGEQKGVGDWRPSSKTPGVYGTFTATVKPARPEPLKRATKTV